LSISIEEQVDGAHPHPSDILRKEKPRAVSADTAVRLARYFGTSPEFWLNLQSAYELSLVLAERGQTIERDVHPRKEVAA